MSIEQETQDIQDARKHLNLADNAIVERIELTPEMQAFKDKMAGYGAASCIYEDGKHIVHLGGKYSPGSIVGIKVTPPRMAGNAGNVCEGIQEGQTSFFAVENDREWLKAFRNTLTLELIRGGNVLGENLKRSYSVLNISNPDTHEELVGVNGAAIKSGTAKGTVWKGFEDEEGKPQTVHNLSILEVPMILQYHDVIIIELTKERLEAEGLSWTGRPNEDGTHTRDVEAFMQKLDGIARLMECAIVCLIHYSEKPSK